MRKRIGFLAIIFCGMAEAQPALVRVNTRNNSPNEVSIAIDPKNPQHMVAAANLTNVYHSKDGGLTWTEKNFKSSHGAYGDPVVIADGLGNFYLAHLALNRDAIRNKEFYSGLDRIVIQKSTDGGETWSDGTYCGLNPGKMQDKPWLSADRHGNIHVTWTEFDRYESKDPKDRSRIRFSKSTDGGLSFSEAITISDTTGDCLDDDNTLEGATTAIGANGEIYAAWAGYEKIYMDVSTDGGKTWGKDEVIANQKGGWTQNIPGFFRCNGMPFIKCDNKGNLYLLYGEEGRLDKESGELVSPIVSLLKSPNGKLWSKELYNEGVMPNFCIDPVNGNWYVNAYKKIEEKRHGMKGTSWFYTASVYCHRKRNYPLTVSAVFALPPKNVFFGDYIDITAYNNQVRPIWMQPDTQQMACYTSTVNENDTLQKRSINGGNQWGVICTSVHGHLVLFNQNDQLDESRKTRFLVIDENNNIVKSLKAKWSVEHYNYYLATMKVKGLKKGVLYHLRVSNPDIKLPDLPFRVWE